MNTKKIKLNKSGVSWTDYSWGIVDGCTKISEGCQNCYAEAMVKRFHPERIFSTPWLHYERLAAPINTKKPGKIFVAPLGDLFHPDIPFEFIDSVFEIMEQAKNHTFQILTKRPVRMRNFFIWAKQWGHDYAYEPLKNVWLGVTAENQNTADHRIPLLLRTPAAVRFVSVEPMLGPVNLVYSSGPWRDIETNYLRGYKARPDHDYIEADNWGRLHLVICGPETGPKRRHVDIQDIRNLKDQCVMWGVKFFLKSMEINGKIVELPELDGQVWNQLPEVK